MIDETENNFYKQDFVIALPHQLQNQRTCIYLLFELLVGVMEKWVSTDVNEILGKGNSDITNLCDNVKDKDMINDEVQSFVGFSVSSRISLLRREIYSHRCKNEKKVKKLKRKLRLISMMRVLHKEVINDEEYREKHYSNLLQLRNRGGLTLLSHQYCHFGAKLMSNIRIGVNYAMIEKA